MSILDKKHDLTVDIAESALSFAEDSGNQLIALGSTPRDCSANLTRNKGRERVGKLVYRISRISIFADGASEKNLIKKKTPERDELNVLCNLPYFQFSRLVKPIHWERLKGLNLERCLLLFSSFMSMSEYCDFSSFPKTILIAVFLCTLFDFWFKQLSITCDNSSCKMFNREIFFIIKCLPNSLNISNSESCMESM